MTVDRDCSAEIAAQVAQACAEGQPLRIRGGDTRAFLGRPVAAAVLEVAPHRGVVAWEPSELVLTARAGTPLAQIEALLASGGQMLAFEPPRFGAPATVGGAIATGMSGPRRAYAGAARDFVLGVRCVNGRGELLSFGGRVMKNVAGYDVSRLMCGAFGTLGVLLEVSLKVLPCPPAELTLLRECDAAAAIGVMNRVAGSTAPLSASSHEGRLLRLRLSGSAGAVRAAAATLGGDIEPDAQAVAYWNALREQSLPFFGAAGNLWRLSLPATAPPLAVDGAQLLEWGGALRWLRSEVEPDAVRAAAAAAGGHATLYRGDIADQAVFPPLAPAVEALHRRLKSAFDPARILNPGRMYSWL